MLSRAIKLLLSILLIVGQKVESDPISKHISAELQRLNSHLPNQQGQPAIYSWEGRHCQGIVNK